MFSQASKAFRRVALRGRSPYYYARKYLEIAATPRDFVTRKRLGAALANGATPADREIVEAVRRFGFHVLPQPLDMTDELVAFCRERLAEFQKNPQYKSGDKKTQKLFWSSLLRPADFSADGILLRFAAQPRLYRLAAMYLGQAPQLSQYELFYSFSTPDDPTHSQLWHRDGLDRRVFKVFVYCTDVIDEDDGPFHVAEIEAVRPIYKQFPYSSRSYTDAQFSRIADTSRVRALAGKAGTTFICDTCQAFHYGSRCVRPRLACFITYSTYAGLYPARPVTTAAPDSPEPLRILLSHRLH